MDSGNVSLSENATSGNKDLQYYLTDLQYDIDEDDIIDDSEVSNENGFLLTGPGSPKNKYHDIYDRVGALDVPPIPQYDGNDSVDEATNDLIVGFGTNNTNIRTRTAQFELNQRKQTAGIYRDAQIEDFKVTYNDHGKNVNIECNSGFYAQVAKPTLSSLANDPIPPVLGFSIVCDNITKNIDALGHEFNLTVFFRVVQSNGNSTKVTVHTHNSKRCVQVQGGSAMPDRSTSAMWFVKNVLYCQFHDLAKAKSFSIAGFNQAITSAGNNPGKDSKKCGFCDRKLDARSYPVNCSNCIKWFHKTNCHKAHKCMSPSLSASTSVSSSVVSLPQSTCAASAGSRSTSSCNSFQQPTTKSTPVTTTSSLTIFTSCSTNPALLRTSSTPQNLSASISATPNPHSSITRSLVITVPTSIPSSPVSTSDTSPPSYLNADAPPYHPPPPPPPPQSKKARQTQHLSTFSPEKAEIESLKIQLSFARTKIADLETKNEDHEQTINIYAQKIKLLHNSQMEVLQEKYFPTKLADSSPPSNKPISLDCDCKIRAQIVRNTLNNKDISQRLHHDQDPTSAPKNSSTAAANSVNTAGSVPLSTSTSSPTTLLLSESSSYSGPPPRIIQADVADNHTGTNQIKPTSAPAATEAVVLESDHESDFDFSESFEVPVESPQVCLN